MSLLPVGFGSSGGYQVQRSVRLRAAASACFSRTPGNMAATTWTISAWVKRGTLGNNGTIFSACDASSANTTWVGFNGDALAFSLTDGTYYIQSSAVYRDPSAWYHVVAVLDTSNATASDRMRLYVNGERITAFSTATYPPQNYTTFVNTAVPHTVGSRYRNGVIDRYHDGEMAEVIFASSSALTPSAFGEQDSATRMWVPKKYTGTYGTNGFYLDFKDNTSATTLAYDKSGNGNNWTPNNISTTAGSTYDSMLDVPTLTSETAANYAVLSPVDSGGDTISNANLNLTTSSGDKTTRASIGVTSGKWYWEVTLVDATASAGGKRAAIGIANQNKDVSTWVGADANSWSFVTDTGNKATNGSGTAYCPACGTGDIIGVALDADNGTLVFYKNGTSLGTAFSGLTSGNTYFPAISMAVASAQSAANFGQRPFAYTPPTGFKALHTGNLPTPTGAAAKPWEHFDTVLYTGNSPSSQTISGFSFAPGLAWFKSRSLAENHNLVDSVRGAFRLRSNTTDAESAATVTLTSNGFTVGSQTESNNGAMVAWSWKAGGAAVTNNAGSITSQVSANTAAGFSIVTYTGTGANATVGHGLGRALDLLIVKGRSTTNDWPVWTKALSGTESLFLNLTNAKQTGVSAWNSTTPSSSLFYLGASNPVNAATNTFVAYCFAEIPGFSKFGSYTGNGSSDGPFVFLGFRARYLLLKRIDSANSWIVYDTVRNTINAMGAPLGPNLSDVEGSNTQDFDIIANGFKLRTTGAGRNANGGTYIYMAFAEAPFQCANAR